VSVPARKVDAAVPAPTPAIEPARSPTREPRSPARTAPPGTPARIARPARRFHVGFVVVSGAVLALLVVGVVTLSAFLAQTAFHLREVEGNLHDLDERQVMLTDQVAHLSSPGAVAKWARQHDMVMPASGDVHILPVPGSGG
jgi:hypothetical protein